MEQRSTRSNPWHMALRVWLWIFVILGLYVLSFGPAFYHWYGAHVLGGGGFFSWFYGPLIAAYQRFPLFRDLVDGQVQFWI